MIGLVKKILSKDIEEIISSSVSLDLLKCYSILYLNGGQPNSCELSQRKYYKQILFNGLQKAKLMEEIKEKTHKIIRKGLLYAGKPFCKHFNLQTLTDKQAADLLEAGYLKKEHFTILPGAKKPEAIIPEVIPEVIDEAKPTKKIQLMNKTELQAVCSADLVKYPAEEWNDLTKKELLSYIKTK